jgi:hypothetical protein
MQRVEKCVVHDGKVIFARLTRFRLHSRHQHNAFVPLRRLGDATTTRVKFPFAGHGRNLHSRE